jgi:ADP-heptose:LPS heptosyltransferase
MAKRVLLMRLSAMGDVAMTVPVVASFAKAYPDINITMLSTPRFQPLFANISNLSFVGVDKAGRHNGIRGLWKLSKEITADGKFDQMIDLHDVLRSKILRTIMRLKGVKVTVVDKGRAEKKALIDGKNKSQLKQMVKRYHETFEKAGYKFDLNYEGYCPNTSTDLSESLNLASHVSNIGIAPFAQHEGKIYPLDKMEQVVKTLSERNIGVYLFGGGKKEEDVFNSWVGKYPNVVSLAGKYKLQEEMVAMKKMDLMLTMDSANMHLASLCGVKVVSIWGATHPYMGFYGYGQDPEDAIVANLDCQPCSAYGNKPCRFGDYRCMTQINSETVCKKVLNILNKTED